ncbi:nuclear transport factor 2 family protein [Streptomyces roseoverticillatus]|uniref:Nuclear transport factor 2 family protein n=1 Tax=Streptomyces roseoverticillatus TaxID=66429 RepID=A0ABV3IVE4_9ACTN
MTAAAYDLGRRFHAALITGDWPAIRSMLHDDATWSLPGDNTISGTVVGADAVVERAQKIASYGLSFELLHVLVSRENMALSLHNTAQRPDAVLDEYLTTVCRLRDGRIAGIETYLSDVPGMNAFFV